MSNQLNTIVEPTWRDNPPVKVNVNGKILGLVVAILAGIALLVALLALISLLGLSAFVGGIFAIAILGVLAGGISDAFAVVGGWQMYQGNAAGKRLVIYGLLISAVSNVVYLIGYAGYAFGGAFANTLVVVIVEGILYYLVVVSRMPGEVPLVP